MAGRPIRLTPTIACAAEGCRASALRITGTDNRPQTPRDWYEVVLGRTVFFAHTMRCAHKVAAGHVNQGRAQSAVPIGE